MNSTRKKRHMRPNFVNDILDDAFHPENPICRIVPTSNVQRLNYFDMYRPLPATCLDYNISQTDTKIDAHDTKIHVQQTIAEYIPDLTVQQSRAEAENTGVVGAAHLVPLSAGDPFGFSRKLKYRVVGASGAWRKSKYFSGGPPQWEFLEEIWQRHQEQQQKMYHIEFKKRVTRRKKLEKLQMEAEYRRGDGLVGPAWYQELSPPQISTVNALKSCILKDLSEDTIINTQENIGQLGIVLRPYHKHIEKALKNCCKCPMEFLLVLYQLMNPKRTEYSINDRLLLSSFVHLAMTETLRELHVRVPSPPTPPINKKKVPKKNKHKVYDSPYLMPYNFERKPPRFSGVYVNKHVQHPESPYFSYLEEFKKTQVQENENKSKPAKLDTVEAEIEEELIVAQTMYEELVDFRPVPKLLKPSRYFPCQNFKNKAAKPPIQAKILPETPETTVGLDRIETLEETEQNVESEIKLEEINEEEIKKEKIKVEEIQNEENVVTDDAKINAMRDADDDATDVLVMEISQRVGRRDDMSQTESYYEGNKENAEKMTEHLCVRNHKTRPTCQRTVFQENSCGCDVQEEYEDIDNFESFSAPEDSKKEGHTCIHASQNNDPTMNNFRHLKKHKLEEYTCKHAEDLAVYNKMYHLIRPNATKEPCKCKENYKQFIEKPLCPCNRCKEDRKNKNINYVISGLKETEPTVTTRIIDRVVERKPCDCLKKYESKIETYEKEKHEEAQKLCDCRKLAKDLIEKPHCNCERCEEDRRQKAAKLILTGTKETESGNIRIIEGISTGKPCQCVKDYEKKVDEYQDFLKSKSAVCKLKEQKDKFILGGVVNTPQGPAYVISGLRPQIDCACAKKAREEEAEAHMQAIMPHIPPGRIQYAISGVKETPEGNVYLLSSALPIEDCECMAVYDTFKKQHSTCMETYENYLVKMKEEYNEFMNDMLPPSSSRRASSASKGSRMSDSFGNQEDFEETKKMVDEYVETKIKAVENKAAEVIRDKSAVLSTCEPYIPCTCQNLYPICCNSVKVENVECVQCTCNEEVLVDCVDCTCGGAFGGATDDEPQQSLKRFFIFPKILCDKRWQKKTLKAALSSMAEDEYPLAKLPESYKLPHFKLWMQMRCKKFWTRKDAYRYICKSKDMWRKAPHCSKWPLHFPDLGLSNSEARSFDWSKAGLCRKLVGDALDKFYRQMRQNNIHFGREYFPTTFSYEFPFKTWRGCYFAYTPNKEEEVQPRYVWQKYDFKNYADMQRFCG